MTTMRRAESGNARNVNEDVPEGRFAELRKDLKAASVEFLGTVFFLLNGLGGIQVANASGNGLGDTAFVAFCMGLSLLTSAWLFYRVTGGLFNPGVALALFLVKAIGFVRFLLYIVAQFAGAIAASALLQALTPGPLLVNTYLQHGTSKAQGVFIEMFITCVLVMAVLMLAAEKHEVTPFAPIGIGLTLLVGHLFAVYYTGAGMNTARSFGPAAVTGFPHSDQWVYWLGPFLGVLLGVAIYTYLKHFHYRTLTPYQTAVEYERSPPDPIQTIKTSLGRSSNASRGEANASEKAARTSMDTRDAAVNGDNQYYRPNQSAV